MKRKIPSSNCKKFKHSKFDDSPTNAERQIVFSSKSAETEPQTLETIEREHIQSVLRQTSGRIKDIGGAAEILGLNPSTVYFRMKKLGIEKDLN